MSKTYLALLVLGLALLQGAVGASGAAELQGEAENLEAGEDVLSVFVIMLVVGIASYHVLAVTRIPYTALLLVGTSFHDVLKPKPACRGTRLTTGPQVEGAGLDGWVRRECGKTAWHGMPSIQEM